MKRVLAVALFATLLTGCAPIEGEKVKESMSSKSDTSALTLVSDVIATAETSRQIQNSDWRIDYYVDEFNDKTDKPYVLGAFSGKFKNSATNNGALTALVYLDIEREDKVAVRLLEYNRMVISTSKNDKIEMNVKDQEGNKYSFILTAEDSDVWAKKMDLRRLVEGIESLSCNIVISNDYSRDSYTFKINNIGLKDLLEEAKKK